jgi:hypothetical protein
MEAKAKADAPAMRVFLIIHFSPLNTSWPIHKAILTFN